MVELIDSLLQLADPAYRILFNRPQSLSGRKNLFGWQLYRNFFEDYPLRKRTVIKLLKVIGRLAGVGIGILRPADNLNDHYSLSPKSEKWIELQRKTDEITGVQVDLSGIRTIDDYLRRVVQAKEIEVALQTFGGDKLS